MVNGPLGKILVVDDEVELKNILVEALASQGYETTGVTSGEAALVLLRAEPFDVLLSDLMMPGMDGIAVVREALQIDPHLVAIIMTGQGTIQTAVDAMKGGAFDYVLKPFRLHTVMPVLTRAMNTRHMRLENLQLRETVAIYELGQTIAFTLDPQTIISKLADAAFQQTDADEVSILFPTENGKELYVAAVRGENRQRLLGERVPLQESISSWVVHQRTPLILDGEINDKRFRALWPRPEIRSAISIPMLVANKLVGTININALGRARPFTLGQMKGLTILAGTAAAALESASLYSQVRRAEENYRSIFDNAVEGIFQSTPQGRFITVNQAMARLFGYDSPKEMIESVTDITHQVYVNPGDRAKSAELTNQEILRGFEFQAYRKDGKLIWLSLNRRSVCDENGIELYREGSVEDITERKRVEEMQARLAAHALFRADVSAALAVNRAPLRTTLELCAAAQVQHLGAAFARVWTLNRDQEVLDLQASAGMYTHIDGGHARVPVGMFKIGKIAQERQPHITNNVQSDPRVSDKEWAQREGMVAFAGYPLIVEDRLLGVMAMFSREALADDTIDALASVADVISQSIERKRAEQELGQSEERYRDLVENAHDIIYSHDLKGNYTSINRAGEQITGYTREECLSLNIADTIAPESLNMVRDLMAQKLAGQQGTTYEIEIVAKNGKRIAVEVNTKLILQDGAPVGVQGIARDVTDRKHLEDQLRQSQKMEAIGQLAGGVAHDFNNLLTAINGYSTLALQRLEDDHPVKSYLEEVKKAGDRAANLTRQLLAFGRKQILQPLPINLNDVVTDMNNMLRRLIGEDIVLTAKLDPALKKIQADPGQIEQVLVNLVVNARDAMPQGGKLTIETSSRELDPEYAAKHVGVQPGNYVMLAVSDTGFGMTEETKGRIFDPFYTTKEKGKGTGLGLSTVYGIIKQSGGNIWVYSEPNRGTTFKVYLPQLEVDVPSAAKRVTEGPIPSGSETILLVEDEDVVRGLTREILEQAGYKVIEAAQGEKAVQLFSEAAREIDLLLTDVVMPGVSGKELANRVTRLRPDLKVLFMSGYTDEAIVHHGVLDSDVQFIQKPFSPASLARKVREVLDHEGS
jgi:PAS domain S-box-containing protein